MHPLLITALVIFGAACLMYVNVKNIAATIYIKTVQVHEGIDSDLPESPYSIYPAKAQNGNIGFSIFKNGRVMPLVGASNQSTVYHTMEDALTDINKFEKIERVRLTKLD
jgi:hypothetical protein